MSTLKCRRTVVDFDGTESGGLTEKWRSRTLCLNGETGTLSEVYILVSVIQRNTRGVG